jgi:hypothetical protein
MSADPSSPIPGKLREEGYAVLIERMKGGGEKRLWSATASRDGMTWNAFGEDLATVLLELERQTQETEADWRETIADEMLETARSFPGNHSSPAQ